MKLDLHDLLQATFFDDENVIPLHGKGTLRADSADSLSDLFPQGKQKAENGRIHSLHLSLQLF